MDTAAIITLANEPRAEDAGGWRELMVNEHPEPTEAQQSYLETLIERARAHAREREESHERCDTDGFLTQYIDGVLSGLERVRAQLVRQGGYDAFPALFNRHTGERVEARIVERRWGIHTSYHWELRDGASYPDTRTRRAKLWKAGYVVLGEWAPAQAYIAGEGRGLSGRAWASTRRCDYGDREGAALEAVAA